MKGKVNTGDNYALSYFGHEKSYVIEPHGGAINYKLAEGKNVEKFYQQVFNQDITKHKMMK